MEAEARALEQGLNSIGRVTWQMDVVTAAPADGTRVKKRKKGEVLEGAAQGEWWQEISHATVKAGSCELQINQTTGFLQGGEVKSSISSSPTVFLEELGNVSVMSYADWYGRRSGASYRVSPIRYSIPLGGAFEIGVANQETAERIASQLRELGEQCKHMWTQANAGASGEPSLATTLNFIVDKLNEQGPVASTVTHSAMFEGDPLTPSHETHRILNAVADVGSCVLSFQSETQVDSGGPVSHMFQALSFRRVEKAELSDQQRMVNENIRKSGGHWEYTYTPNPSALIITETAGIKLGLIFRDSDLADRVAKAMIHAVEICGGGNKDPF